MLASKKTLLLILSLCMLVVACSPKVEPVATNPPQAEREINIEVMETEAIDKDLLQVLTNGIEGVFNPLFAMTEGDKAISHLMFLPFIGMKANMEVDPQNGLVSSMTREGYSLSFAISDDARWWDGNPVTANDIYFSLRVLLHPEYLGEKRRGELLYITGARDYNNGLASGIKGVEVIDEKHLKINFDNFQDSFYYALDFRPIPIHYYQGARMNDVRRLNSKPLGNGPYMLADWEKNNFANLERNDDFKYPTNIKELSLREFSEENIVVNMLRGHIDAANIYNDLEALGQSQIKKNFEKNSVIENEVILLRISNYNGMEDLTRREQIIDILKDYRPGTGIKFSNSLISHTNKAFFDMDYEDKDLEKNYKSIPLNLVYEDNPYIRNIAQDLKDLLSDYGYIVTLNGASPYDLISTASKLINSGRSVLVLNSFKHGYMPDFSREFSSTGDGKYLFHDLDLDEEIFELLVDKKSDLKDAYKLLCTDIKNKNIAIGFGNPITETFIRKSLRGFLNTEFTDWFDLAVWDMSWE